MKRLNNQLDSLKFILKKGGKLAKDFWVQTKIEKEETKIAIFILYKIIKRKKVSTKEIKFLKEQSKDLLKILPLLVFQGIPIPLTPFWILLAKYNPGLLPKDHRGILKEDKPE